MPKLSIVIPTKNRYETLFSVVKSLLKYIQGDNYEIVINDNSDNNELAIEFLENNSDKKIAYYYTTEPLSQSGNSNSAISKAKGDYITFIGDDDLVSPYIMDAIKLMEEQGIDCLAYSIGSYYWATTKVTKKTKLMKPSLLVLPPNMSSVIQDKLAEKELDKMLNFGGVSIMQLPRLYHGILSKKILKKLYEKNGTYAVGSCPDMNIAVVLASIIDKYKFVNYSLTISGVSKNSAAGMDARNSHRAELQTMVDSGFLPAKVIEDWNPLLPKVWTIPTIYAQALYEALKSIGIKKEVNYTSLYAIFLWRENWAIKYLKTPLKLAIDEGKTTYIKVVIAYLKWHFRKFGSYLLKPIVGSLMNKPMNEVREGIDNTDQCMEELMKKLF